MHIALPALLRTALPALLLALLLLTTLASAARAASQVRLENRGDGIDATARVLVLGDGNASQVTVQRSTQAPGDPVGDRITITDASGVTRDESDALTSTAGGGGYCGNDGPTRVFCVVVKGSAITTAGSDLGGGSDAITVTPAVSGAEIRLDVDGGPGNDILVGGAGNDRLEGGDGSDQLAGLGGADFFLDAGTGAGDVDTVSYDDSAHTASGVNVTIGDGFSNDGTEGVDGPGAATLDNVGAGVERIIGTDFDDFLFGSPANNVLVGGLGHDALFGEGGADRLEARDDTADGTLNCGAGTDTVVVDDEDPAPVQCEETNRPGIAPGLTLRATLTKVALPDIRRGVYAGLSIDGIEAQLSTVVPSTIVAQPLDYAQAAARAGKSRVTPFDVVGSSPNPGARVTGSPSRPVVVKAYFWDPTKDVRKQRCDKDIRVRGAGGRGPRLSLRSALKGLGFREGKAGDEGDAQDLLRRIGCPYDASFTYSAKAKEARVTTAGFGVLTRRTKSGGKVKTSRVKGYRLRVQVPREQNDFLTTFTQPLSLRSNELPLSEDLTLPAGRTLRLLLNVREKATGRIAEGTLVELVAPGGGTVAAGKTGADGMVSLTAYIAAKGDYELFMSRSRTDPTTKDPVDQEGLTALRGVTPGATWTTVSGSTIAVARSGRAARTAAAGPTDPVAWTVGLVRELAAAQAAKALADRVKLSAGMTQAQADALLGFFLQAAAVPLDSIAATTVGVRRLNLVPGIAATRTGPLCPSWQAPSIAKRNAVGMYRDAAFQGTSIGARFDCGRAVMIDPTTGLLLVGAGYAIGSALIANDGASLIANDGASLIANDGASLIANDGASFVPLTPLLANDGASIISDHGAGIVSNHSGAIVSNHSSGLVQPIGAGTTFQSVGG